jgi:hypothetical protein
MVKDLLKYDMSGEEEVHQCQQYEKLWSHNTIQGHQRKNITLENNNEFEKEKFYSKLSPQQSPLVLYYRFESPCICLPTQ